jgi:hypothetical protein
VLKFLKQFFFGNNPFLDSMRAFHFLFILSFSAAPILSAAKFPDRIPLAPQASPEGNLTWSAPQTMPGLWGYAVYQYDAVAKTGYQRLTMVAAVNRAFNAGAYKKKHDTWLAVTAIYVANGKTWQGELAMAQLKAAVPASAPAYALAPAATPAPASPAPAKKLTRKWYTSSSDVFFMDLVTPGSGQCLRGNWVWGMLLSGATWSCAYLAYKEYNAGNDSYVLYQGERTPAGARARYDEAASHDTMMQVYTYAAGGLYLLGLLDAVIGTPIINQSRMEEWKKTNGVAGLLPDHLGLELAGAGNRLQPMLSLRWNL